MINKDLKLDTSDSIKLADDIIKNLGEMTKDEKGEVIANTTITYIKMINELNARHIEALEETLALLNDLEKEKREVGDTLKIAKVRSDLN